MGGAGGIKFCVLQRTTPISKLASPSFFYIFCSSFLFTGPAQDFYSNKYRLECTHTNSQSSVAVWLGGGVVGGQVFNLMEQLCHDHGGCLLVGVPEVTLKNAGKFSGERESGKFCLGN